MKRNAWIVVAALLLAGIAMVQSLVSAQPREELPKKQYLAPSFELKDFDGKSHRVGGPQDTAYLINFWASWCDPCRIEAPDLVELQSRHADKLTIYAVNARSFDKLDAAKAFADEFKFTFPVLLDEQGEVLNLYKVYGFPTTFFVSKDGVIQDIAYGVLTPELLRQKTAKLVR